MDITTFVLKEIFQVAAALFVLGFIFKQSQFIPDKYIPIILLILGIGGSFGLLAIDSKANITSAVIQGILATGIAVMTNQIPKQLVRKDK